ncbi:MAG: restriction endonuclease PLD domain-containing protein [Prolixibacteraceae bacterium]
MAITEKTEMQIINNRTRNNHKAFLINCFENSDSIIIVIPFISNTFDFFPFDKFKYLRKITFLTTLKPNDIEQPNKVEFFRQIFDYGKVRNVEIEILIDNSLHGKLYICRKDGVFLKALITSANFTSNGLRINNEWGICLDNSVDIENIVTDLRNNVVIEPITELILVDFENKIKRVTKPQPTIKYDLKLIDGLKLKGNPLNIPSNINYWLKPMGVRDKIIPRDRIFDEIDSDLHFSDKKPSGVKKGDILIAYAVGHKKILSIYKVNSEIKNTGNIDDRWPYYVVGENQTPFYGTKWNNYNLTISNQKQEALNSGIAALTPSGKNSYGSLMRGADKLRITKEFADFMINKIVKINDEISTMANKEGL